MRELPLTTNTARLAHYQLQGSELRLRGVKDQELSCEDLALDSRRSLLYLFPSEHAISIDSWLEEHPNQAVTLVVPDGNWKQCSKVYRRVPGLKNVVPVKLPKSQEKSLYTLRKEPRDECFSTYEAMMRALQILENHVQAGSGDQLRAQMDHVFSLKMDRTQFARGKIAASEVYGGVSEYYSKKIGQKKSHTH
jgi:DTW domain-containing protein YfiP